MLENKCSYNGSYFIHQPEARARFVYKLNKKKYEREVKYRVSLTRKDSDPFKKGMTLNEAVKAYIDSQELHGPYSLADKEEKTETRVDYRIDIDEIGGYNFTTGDNECVDCDCDAASEDCSEKAANDTSEKREEYNGILDSINQEFDFFAQEVEDIAEKFAKENEGEELLLYDSQDIRNAILDNAQSINPEIASKTNGPYARWEIAGILLSAGEWREVAPTLETKHDHKTHVFGEQRSAEWSGGGDESLCDEPDEPSGSDGQATNAIGFRNLENIDF